MFEKLKAALTSLAAGQPLREGAVALFEALGYQSERVLDLRGVSDFLESYDRGKLTRRQRQLFDQWSSVEIVFQVTDEEIAGSPDALGGRGFDKGRIKSFLFLAVDLNGDGPTRTYLAGTARVINRLFAMPTVVLFRYGNALTLVVVHRRANKMDDTRDVLEKVTLIKDIQTDVPHRAHIEILAELALPKLVGNGVVRNFDALHAAWEKALDIEVLNRRFYRDLFFWFERAVGECRFPDDSVDDSNMEGTSIGDRKHDAINQRQVIRLITRILFIWFLKEKGLVPSELFEEDFAHSALKDYEADSTDYYRAVLQNLFFATLNSEIAKRGFVMRDPNGDLNFTKYLHRDLLTDPEGLVEKLKIVPFVNGGLFDCLDSFIDDEKAILRIDAFSEDTALAHQLKVPAHLFFNDTEDSPGLFPLFRRYKFTVEENTPLDREVALDPELLGRVFENLLATYNPETSQTARKATGSYYTPRHIVDYMVGETLIAVLAERATPADGDPIFWRERLSYLLNYEDAFEDAEDLFEHTEANSVVGAIADIRVLDPAAGSGAFPMGILHRLTLALRRLDPKNIYWEDLQRKRAVDKAKAAFYEEGADTREEELREINHLFETYRDSDYGRKLYLIQNGLFGIDIQPIACQIAKLRFFISLIVEQDSNGNAEENYGIRPLPNLETRFVAANTLIGFTKPRQDFLGSEHVEHLENQLRSVRERHFNARTRHEKQKLQKRDYDLRVNLAQELEALGLGHDSAKTIARWDPYNQNTKAEWFDPEYMFGIAEGFDMVIGNPPYVRADFQDKRHKETRRAILESRSYATLSEKWDLFIPFMEKSFNLLRAGGVTSLIVSDAFGHAKYALKAREWFLKNALVERIDFFNKIKIFDAAVHNLSYVFRKADGTSNMPLRCLHEQAFGVFQKLPSAPQNELTERVFFPSDSYVPPPNPVIALGDICYISSGMVLNAHEKLAHGKFTLDDVTSDKQDVKHPKAYIEGKHLDRWYPKMNRWLEWGTDRAPSLFRRPTFQGLYEVAEKLVSIDMTASENRPKVAFDDQKLYHNHSMWSIVPWHELSGIRNRSIKRQARYAEEKDYKKYSSREHLERNSLRFSIKYILGIMNSQSAYNYLIAHRRSNIHLYPDDWKKLPIPDISKNDQQVVVGIVDMILATKRSDPCADVTDLEKEIDKNAELLYGFTE